MAKARREALETIGETIVNLGLQKIYTFLPVGLTSKLQGIHFENTVRKLLCGFLDDDGYTSYLHFGVALNRNGTPLTPGVTCEGVEEKTGKILPGAKAGFPNVRGTVWPDIIIGDKAPLNEKANGYPKTWVVGEIKRSTKTLYNSYIRNPNSTQLEGIVNYAKKHTHSKVVFFLAAKKATGKQYRTVEATLAVKVVAKGAVPVVDTIFDSKGKRRR